MAGKRCRKRHGGAAGRGPAWLRRLTGGQEDGGLEPPVPTQTARTCSQNVCTRRWSDARLIQAAPQARSWSTLLVAIGVQSTSQDYRRRVKGPAVRLGRDLSHLDEDARQAIQPASSGPDLRNRRDAATMLAAFWFSLCGFGTAIPVE